MRSILFVTQVAPPSTLVAARRVGGFAKYLGRAGYDVTVLASRVSGTGSIDGASAVVRTNDLMLTPLNWRRGHFDSLAGEGRDGYASPSVLERVVVPDVALATWLPFALPRALRLARARRFDCVVTSSPPQSAHLVGLALKRAGLRWIADFRDGWSFEPHRQGWPTRPQRVADARLERRVARRADAAVAVTEPIADDLRRRLGVRVETITNGFDPEDEVDDAGPAGLDPNRIPVVHTGRVAAARSSLEPVLDAVRRLRAETPEAADRLELVLAGPLSAEERQLIAAPDVKATVSSLGQLPRPAVLALQRRAACLLVITEGDRRRSVATGKLFEYLAARRPVLVLGEGTEAARIAVDAGVGTAVSATDPSAIAAALRQVLETPDARPQPSDGELRQYAYPALAARLAELIEDVCEC
jgi:glycosyltransferase involved in cell wall biosynthesis